ncbi:MAG TPA: YkgJ family cysteine cluster protein [Methanocellaceae archaeon]
MQTSTTSKFECQRCGNCCRRREDIPLTLDDIFRISDFLNMDPDEFFKEHCVEIAPDPEHVASPFLHREYDGCHFLEDGLCTINFVKPHVCKITPSTIFGSIDNLKIKMPFNCSVQRLEKTDKVNETDRIRKSYIASMMLTTIYYSKFGTFNYDHAKPFVYKILLFNKNREYIHRMFDNTVAVQN